MIVIGGIYEERCERPHWNQIFGSGGRAACVISKLFGVQIKLVSQYSKKKHSAIDASFASYKIDKEIRKNSTRILFDYVHPLSQPKCHVIGKKDSENTTIVTGNKILLFGMMEGLPKVNANKLVIDPQGENLKEILESEKIQANEISIVANEKEITGIRRQKVSRCVRLLFETDSRVQVIVVKRGVFGCYVFRRRAKKIIWVPPYSSQKVFKIGSGDVFSAVFSYAFMCKGLDVTEASDLASRAVSCYVAAPHLNFSMRDVRKAKALNIVRKKSQIYLAGPFFSFADDLILYEAYAALSQLKISVFSPRHHVGMATTNDSAIIAEADLRGLRKSQAVLALLHNTDPGTVFEIGYARAKRKPVVVVGEYMRSSDATMLEGTYCEMQPDFCTAIYKSVWASLSR